MHPWVAMAILDALIKKLLGRILSLRAQGCRQRAADRGKCPTCRDPIPGLDPVPSGEHRVRPWTYCDDCRAEDRARKADRKAADRMRKAADPRAA